MSMRRFTQEKAWVSLVVVLSLLAPLLPAGAKPVFAQSPSCGQAVARSATAADVVHAADDEVKLTKAQVDLATLEALLNSRYSGGEKLETIFVSYLAESGGNSLDVVKILPIFDENLIKAIPPASLNDQDLYPYDDIVHTMFDVALRMPEIAPLVPSVWEKFNALNTPGPLESYWFGDSASLIAASSQRYSLAAGIIANAADTFEQARDCAIENPEFAKAFNQLFGDTLNAGILDDAKTVLANNPALPIPAEIRGHIAADGTITLSLDELKKLSDDQFNTLHTSIDDMQSTLGEIDKQQDVIVDYLKDQELKAKWQALIKKQTDEHQLKIDAAKASISILTTLAGAIDPKFAKQLNVVGTSTIQIADSLNSWLKAVSGLNGLDKVTSLSTVVMTGNVLGAVMNVVSLFGDQQPTPDQMILEQIGQLRQQVDQLRTEMHSRFDRVDEELNAVYTSMQQRFDQINVQLGKIDGDVQEVQQALVTLDLSLSRIERNNYEFLNTLGRRPLLDAINGGLGYQQRTGDPMPYEPQFVDFENTLQGWGTIHAFDAVNAGPTQRDYSDGQVLAELSAYPLDSNLNYLNGWVVAHGLPPFSDKRLPSPRDWLFASRAYTQLGLEWPQHMRRIDPQRQAALDQVGTDLETAMHNLSTQLTPNGPQGNSLLYTTVISYYQSKVDAVGQAIHTMEGAYVDDVRVHRLQRTDPFDLYGGIDQALAYQAAGFQQMSYGDSGGTLPLPSNLVIPNFNRYTLAEYFKLFGAEQASITLDGFMSNVHVVPNCTPQPDACPLQGDLSVDVAVHYGDVKIYELALAAGSVILPVIGIDVESPTDYIVNNWATLKPRFEAQATEVVPAPDLAQQRAALLDDMSSKLEQRLASYQQEFDVKVQKEMTQGSLKPLATELAGAKALLESFVALGLPRAAAGDEFLHAMLYGNQQLVDDSQIEQSYALSATQPITEMNVISNPRVSLAVVAGQRVDALRGLLKRYLDAITSGNHVEAADYVANTRRDLDLTMRIVHLDLPQQPTGGQATKQIFLPTVRR